MTNEIQNMINVSENDEVQNEQENVVNEITETVTMGNIAPQEVETEVPAVEEAAPEADPVGDPTDEAAPEADPVVDPTVLVESDCVTVSDVILQNVDKHIKMTLLNDLVHANSADADVSNYIVYVNTDKKIPCIYDCQKLIVPKASVQNADGTWNITSIEGRRSGFVIKCPGRDLVMSKNFIYDIIFNESGNIVSISEYNRKHANNNVVVEVPPSLDYDVVSFCISSVLPKIVKCGKYKTIPELYEQVKNSYNNVDDINAMFKIAELRLKIGC